MLLPGCPAGADDSQKISHRYVETTGRQSNEFLWMLAEGSPCIITVGHKGTTFENICDPDGRTREWRQTGPDTRLAARRAEHTIKLAGVMQGRTLDKSFTIDDAPWYQPLTFSLRTFLQSPKTGEAFWLLLSDRLRAVKMQAEKAGEETLTIAGKPVLAWKVRVRPAGLLSMLWEGTYWYRVPDGLFVRYEGANGLPGADKTVIEIVE